MALLIDKLQRQHKTRKKNALRSRWIGEALYVLVGERPDRVCRHGGRESTEDMRENHEREEDVLDCAHNLTQHAISWRE